MGESGNTWELVKSNNLSPTKGSLYKGMRADRVGVGFLECEKRRDKATQREAEKDRERKKGERKVVNIEGKKAQRE